MSIHFQFLQSEWPQLYEAAAKAESFVYPDPRAACFYSRRALELAVTWLFECDGSLREPYKDDLSAYLFEPSFKSLVGPALHTKLDIIRRNGNHAVHSNRAIRVEDAIATLKELFHFCYWLGRNYGLQSTDKPAPKATFNPQQLPKTSPIPPQTVAQLQQLADQLAAKDEQLAKANTANTTLQAEIEALQSAIAQAKVENAAQPDTHDYTEAETRDYFIDLLLKESGWPLDQVRDREYPVHGMPNNAGDGFVDYVLWGDDGKPLGLIEAKRTKRGPEVGQQQAKLYADCLEQQFGQRPVIFYTNGYEHWMWDDASYSPRQVQGFLKKTELELIIQRRSTKRSLITAEINHDIAGRYYQTRAIRRICESFEHHNERKALLVMATGAGKTRTVVALCELLMRCNWAKRVLFLADRVALVNQAATAFKEFLPASSPVNLVTEKNTEGRVYVSTYPTMMGLINDVGDGQRKFGVGHFDLVIIDEAHRSVYQKYRTIFDYFDSFLVGLTATPREEIDFNTYKLFDLETRVPTDVYTLEDAVRDRFLVPPKAVSVPLRFQRQGIHYDELSEEEKERWDELEWNEDGDIPDSVDPRAVNEWLFNTDTVDKVLAHLMTRGLKVEGGDRLGKTIIFAKNNDHAKFIYERFNANYPHYNGEFARIVTYKTEYAQDLINKFSLANQAPHIAISVDMLDTGIDVPEVVNLVLFKLVRSKTKFWQMLGRGTRLKPELFGPGQNKEFFYLFDYCQNLEFFRQNPELSDGAPSKSLGKSLFTKRLELLSELDKRIPASAVGEQPDSDGNTQLDPTTERELRDAIARQLHAEVAAMNVDNFIVRSQRQRVETYADAKTWHTLQPEQIQELATEIAGLPSELPTENEEAKRFDLLLLRLQLARLKAEPSFLALSQKVQAIAAALTEKDSIPMVREQMELIQEIRSDLWWQDVTISMLDQVRRKLRSLVRLIEKAERQPVYTDFTDELGEETIIEMEVFSNGGDDFERFREKARHFLRDHKNHITIHRLRFNEPLTPTDLHELERMLLESGVATPEHLERAKAESQGLGLFIRSLVGLDQEAAKNAFGDFLAGTTASANQIEFINLIIDRLTQQGSIEIGDLYESPFIDISSQGPDGIFNPGQIDSLLTVLDRMRATAAA